MLEEIIKKEAPELFTKEPSLMHQLVTTISPKTLYDKGVPVSTVLNFKGSDVGSGKSVKIWVCLVQGCPTRDPRAACGPLEELVRPFFYLSNCTTARQKQYFWYILSLPVDILNLNYV